MHPELRRERPANGGSGPSAFHRACIADLCCVLYEGPLWALCCHLTIPLKNADKCPSTCFCWYLLSGGKHEHLAEV